MEFAAFLRGVNVGRRTLATGVYARSFTEFRVANVGAAGTFAISDAPPEPRLREALLEHLPFPTEAILVSRTVLRRLLATPPVGEVLEPGSRRSVTFLTAAPRSPPALPLERPVGGPWEVRLLELRPPGVVGQYLRRRPDRVLYPNAVVEMEFGVPATTRWWETLEQVEAAFARAMPPTRLTRRPGPERDRSGSRAPGPRGRARSDRRTPGRTG